MGEAGHPRTTRGSLPAWDSVLAVVAHPDDESFGLGALIDGFVRAGSTAAVLCLTSGEASTIGAVADLRAVRASELRTAAAVLGVESTILRDYPDGSLAEIDRDLLTAEVLREARSRSVSGLLVFDPSGVSAHPDHSSASHAALAAASEADLPVLGWTLPLAVTDQLNVEFEATFIGHPVGDIDLVVHVERDRQRTASLAHVSQAVPTSVLWRRLELLGDHEHLRWLRR